MSAQSPAGIDEPEKADHPSRSDGFVRGLSEVIGGPIGEHVSGAGRRGTERSGRFWTAARIVLALTCLTLALHWVQKSPCQSAAWQNNMQYTRFCYTDVLALYYADGLSEGKVPYRDFPVEYPVVTGYFMGALGLPVHNIGVNRPEINQGQWFYNLNALVLGALAVATVAMILALRRRRPWDAAMFALSPALLVTATVNWDLLAIGLAAIGLYFWAKRQPVAAGILLGLAAAAKLWPAFILGPLFVLALRTSRFRAMLTTAGTAVATIVAVNLPVAIRYPEGWGRFFELNDERAIDWGTLWYIGRYLDSKWNSGGPGDQGPFQWLGDHIPVLNNLSYALFGLACVGIGALALLAPRRPRLAALAFLVVAAFLIFSKVWSQQFTLWLLPLAVLARPRWGAFLVWQFAEIGYFVAFYGELLGAAGKQVFPEGVFVFAATFRLTAVVVLCGLIVRDILHPERDPVRDTYPDDPDGGAYDDAPDAGWLRRWRSTREPDAQSAPV